MKRSELLTKLARELDSWPLQTADVPQGMPGMWCYDAAEVPEERGVFVWATHSPGRDDDTINVHDWLAEKKRLASEPEPPEWDGEGLPPVGCECEYRHKAKNNEGWNICRVIGQFGEWIWIQIPERIPHSIRTSTFKFRPIRSAEDEAVEAINSVIHCRSWNSREHRCRALYAAIRDGEVPGIKLEDV